MRIEDNVYQLVSSPFSHIFLIKAAENVLIDTGMPGITGKILNELQTLGVAPADLGKILLTHHDIDHIGNAKGLQNATGAGLFASEQDIPYITGEKSRPGVKRLIQSIVRPPRPVISGSYAVNQHIGDIRVIPAPGHTPGHTIFQYRDILFTGDLFKILHGRFQLMGGRMTWNREEGRKSIRQLKELDFTWICPSHGEPIQNSRVVTEFLAQF